MLLLTFLVSYFGIRFVCRTNAEVFQSIGVSEKKLSVGGQLFAVLTCFFCFWMDISAFYLWWMASFVLAISPIVTFLARKFRENQIPERCLHLMDDLILSMKSGHSFRQSIQKSSESEFSWFRGFLQTMKRSIETDSRGETDSLWFNRWLQEIQDIEKSKSRTIEQLETVRKYVKVELEFRKKLKRVSDGPKMQAFFMSFLFIILNFICWQSVSGKQMKMLWPVSWVFYLCGVVLTWSLLRLFKWKV